MTPSAPPRSCDLALGGSLPVLLEYRNGPRWRISAGLLVEGLLLGTVLTVPLLFPDRFNIEPGTPQVTILPRLGTPDGRPQSNTSGGRHQQQRTSNQAAFVAPIRIPPTILPEGNGPAIPGNGPGPGGGEPGPGIPGGDPNGGWPVGNTAQPHPPAPTTEPIPVGGNIRPPRLLQRVEPVYPRLAVAAHVEGDVVLTAIIDTDGRVRQLSVKGGHPSLAPAAREAVAQWLYEPTILNGRPVAVQLDVTVKFRLNR